MLKLVVKDKKQEKPRLKDIVAYDRNTYTNAYKKNEKVIRDIIMKNANLLIMGNRYILLYTTKS